MSDPLLDRAKISAAAALVIIVTLVSAMAWFLREIPTKKDVEDNDAKSTRIVTWVKELDQAKRAESLALEARIQAQLSTMRTDNVSFQVQVLRRLEVIDGDVKNILTRLPHKAVADIR